MALPILVAAALKTVVARVITKRLGDGSSAVAVAAAEEIVGAVADDPVVKNEMNAEKPYQSRVAVGATAVLAGSAIQVTPIGEALDTLAPVVVGLVNLFGAGLETPAPGEVAKVVGAVMIVWGGAYTLYGRFKSNLKPLFSK